MAAKCKCDRSKSESDARNVARYHQAHAAIRPCLSPNFYLAITTSIFLLMIPTPISILSSSTDQTATRTHAPFTHHQTHNPQNRMSLLYAGFNLTSTNNSISTTIINFIHPRSLIMQLWSWLADRGHYIWDWLQQPREPLPFVDEMK